MTIPWAPGQTAEEISRVAREEVAPEAPGFASASGAAVGSDGEAWWGWQREWKRGWAQEDWVHWRG